VCNIPLNAAQFSDVTHLSPSLSPDGTKILWGDDQGVEVASLATPTNCASIVPHLLIAGGSEPFYGKGNEQPGAPNPAQPGGPTPGPGPQPGPQPGPTPPHPGALPANMKKPRITRRGSMLTCNAGTWANHPTHYAYGWKVNGKTRRHASARRLKVTRPLHGHKVQCTVAASNAAGRASATSRVFRVR
jgi:hypothetical protein